MTAALIKYIREMSKTMLQILVLSDSEKNDVDSVLSCSVQCGRQCNDNYNGYRNDNV